MMTTSDIEWSGMYRGEDFMGLVYGEPDGDDVYTVVIHGHLDPGSPWNRTTVRVKLKTPIEHGGEVYFGDVVTEA